MLVVEVGFYFLCVLLCLLFVVCFFCCALHIAFVTPHPYTSPSPSSSVTRLLALRVGSLCWCFVRFIARALDVVLIDSFNVHDLFSSVAAGTSVFFPLWLDTGTVCTFNY